MTFIEILVCIACTIYTVWLLVGCCGILVVPVAVFATNMDHEYKMRPPWRHQWDAFKWWGFGVPLWVSPIVMPVWYLLS